MLSDQQLRDFEEQGYVLGSRVIDAAEVDTLRAELERVISDQHDPEQPQPVSIKNLGGNPDAPVWQIVNISEASPAFAALTRNATLLEEAAQLTGAQELRLWHDQIQYKPASIGGVNMWHQDSPLWSILQPKDAQLTCWVALDDVDADNGCMSMVPGTQRLGDTMDFLRTLTDFQDMPREFGGEPLGPVTLRPVRAGYVHFHHPLTWHGSHANTSGRPRRAIAVHVMTERTVYDPSGEHVMKRFVPPGTAAGARLQGDAFPLVWPQD